MSKNVFLRALISVNLDTIGKNNKMHVFQIVIDVILIFRDCFSITLLLRNTMTSYGRREIIL